VLDPIPKPSAPAWEISQESGILTLAFPHAREEASLLYQIGEWTNAMANYECRSDIVQAIQQRLQCMIDRYCRTYLVRLDIRFPHGYVAMNANEKFSELMKQLKEYYTYHQVATQYVGVREQNTSENPHYHVALLFDGSKVDNGWAVGEKAAGIWQVIVGLGAGVHRCEFAGKYGIKIVRPKFKAVGLDLQTQQAAFRAACHEAMTWLSYLAKTATKGCAPPNARELFCSRLPVR